MLGEKIRKAFSFAKSSVQYTCQGQTPQFDDNGNGIGNEITDGLLAVDKTVGIGIGLTENTPLIGSISPDITLSLGSSSSVIWADDVTSTGIVSSVMAVITPPSYMENLPGHSENELPSIFLDKEGSHQYEGIYNDFDYYGSYTIAIYAKDNENNLSFLSEMVIFRPDGPDIYENDDTYSDGNMIFTEGSVQRHNFHDEEEKDWVKFYGNADKTYEIITDNLETSCTPVTTLYDTDGTTILGDTTGTAPLSWRCPEDGIYYAVVAQANPSVYGENTGYDLSISIPEGGLGLLQGYVISTNNELIEGAKVIVTYTTGNSDSQTTSNTGKYKFTPSEGFWPVHVEADGYIHSEEYVDIGKDTSKVFWVTGADPVIKGDINDDKVVDQSDAGVVLVVLTGGSPSSGTCPDCIRPDYAGSGVDVNGDDKIGPEELVYILEIINGLR